MSEKQPISLSHPAKFIGTWFGVGLSPKMPGTMGSIAALPFAWVIQGEYGNSGLFVASLLAFIVGTIACEKYLPYVDAQDPKEMVIDEVHGQWLLLSCMPRTLLSYAVGLFLFRLFDILKPWPISVADRRIHGGFGVMFDDTLAAVYPLVILAVVEIGWEIIMPGHPGPARMLWHNLGGDIGFWADDHGLDDHGL